MKNSNSSDIKITYLLGLLFVALKLIGAITWSWWWVTIPFWGPAALAVLFSALFTFYYFLK